MLLATAALAVLLSPLELCLSAAVLRLPCPGCGMTRASLALVHGDIKAALAFHPLSIVLVPCVLLFFAAQGVRYVGTGNSWSTTPLPRWTEVLAAALIAMLVVVWIARFFGYFGGPVSV